MMMSGEFGQRGFSEYPQSRKARVSSDRGAPRTSVSKHVEHQQFPPRPANLWHVYIGRLRASLRGPDNHLCRSNHGFRVAMFAIVIRTSADETIDVCGHSMISALAHRCSRQVTCRSQGCSVSRLRIWVEHILKLLA